MLEHLPEAAGVGLVVLVVGGVALAVAAIITRELVALLRPRPIRRAETIVGFAPSSLERSIARTPYLRNRQGALLDRTRVG